MSNTNTGGPAFPVFPDTAIGHAGAFRGMTLRDYFAAKVMQGICASGPGVEFSDDRLARDAYAIADAMLKAREQ
jgi:hypothetical protein